MPGFRRIFLITFENKAEFRLDMMNSGAHQQSVVLVYKKVVYAINLK